MQIIGYRYSKLNLIIIIAIGLFLILFGLKLIFQSFLSYNDFDRFLGPISKIDIIDNKNPNDENRLVIQLKNYNNTIYINDIQLKETLKIGDSITVYAKLNAKIKNGQGISNVFGLYFKDRTLIDLNEKLQINRWIGILLNPLGLIIIFVALIYYRFSKKEKYKYVDIDIDNLPYY